MPDGLEVTARHFYRTNPLSHRCAMPTPSVKTWRFCQLPQRGSLWRSRKRPNPLSLLPLVADSSPEGGAYSTAGSF